ncbi:MAG: phage baseplate assembly protein V [Paludibacteraceae bacterium]|nr:phage baseplate assembly protein V [Paludibacteraceae bacterium]
MAASYLRLTLSGIKSKEDGNDVAYMNLRFNNTATESSLPDGSTVKVTPKSIFFHRMVGGHNTIKTELVVLVITKEDQKNASLFFDLRDFFASGGVSLHRCHKDGKQQEVVETNNHSLAEGYKVFNVYPSFETKGEKTVENNYEYTFKVELDIASWDLLMDQTRYSRAYTAKKLGDDIMKGMVSSIQQKYDVSGMRILRQKVGPSDAIAEVIQPYLVQYNETDYEFLLRNANRCGEFFYFEDGKLYLGLSTDEKTKKEITNAKISAVPCTVQPNDGAKLFYQNSCAKTSSSAPSGTDKPFVAEYSNEDCFLPLEKDKYDNADAWEGLNPGPVFRVFGEVFQMDKVDLMSVFDVVNNSVWKVNQVANTFSKKSNDNFNDKYFGENIPNKSSRYSNDKKKYAEFSDLYGEKASNDAEYKVKYQPSTSAFFNNIRTEARLARQQYSVTEYGAGLDYWLGQIVTLEGVKDKNVDKRFVVVGIDCEYRNGVNSIAGDYTKITIIPEGDLPLPLPANVPYTLKAGAQPAVVVDSSDPMRLGRVRVRYNWQGKGGDATPWIRVTTPFSSWKPKTKNGDDDTGDAGSGMFCKLNAGDDVMVDYENGNIERPYVVGSLYGGNRQDGGRQTPYGGRNYSHIFRSRYGHMIGIREPSKGTGILTSLIPGLSLFGGIPGFSDMIKPEAGENVKQALGGFDICDNNGLYSISTSSDARRISISSPFGTVGIDAAMGITVSAPNGNIKIVGKNVDIIAGNNLTLKSGENVTNSLYSAVMKSPSGFDVFKDRFATSITDKISDTFNVPAIRFALELLLRPIQGTLKIHSGRHLILESDGKNTPLPEETFSPSHRKHNDKITELLAVVIDCIKYLNTYKNIFFEYYRQGLREKRSIVYIAVRNKDLLELKKELTDNEIKKKIDDLITGGSLEEKELASFFFDKDDVVGTQKIFIHQIIRSMESLRETSTKIKNEGFKPRLDDFIKVKDFFKNPKILIKGNGTISDDVLKFNIEKYGELFEHDYKKTVRDELKKIIIEYVGNDEKEEHVLLEKEGTANKDFSDIENWYAYVDGLSMNWKVEDKNHQQGWFGKTINKLLPVDTFDFVRKWNPGSHGSILFRNESNSLKFDGADLKIYESSGDLEKLKSILKDRTV